MFCTGEAPAYYNYVINYLVGIWFAPGGGYNILPNLCDDAPGIIISHRPRPRAPLPEYSFTQLNAAYLLETYF